MKALTFIFAFGLNLACSNSKDHFTQQTINPILIGKGELYGNCFENLSQKRLVITNQNEWNDLILKLNSINNVTNSFTETDIAFDTFQIIAVFDDVKQYGGYSIDITNITENEKNIIVTVQHLLTGGINTVISQPYHIVKIPKSAKPLLFE